MAAVVAAGIERAHEVALRFEEAALALSADVDQLLAELAPMDTPLSAYTGHISRFRAAAQAAVNATPTEVRPLGFACRRRSGPTQRLPPQ